ncbi:hypothetical protein [Fibrella forsythiae]|uniref:Uncharacterized protein n=1 Tax=Fibrella forsythiae TaxID=2817061 RepID=A0ABS3JBD0_9BACT|nr:hypothetical protein [Fibrella forsythiae]MBO0947292.1 hypothetical protein [Fibrella forsythiae]
MKNPVEERFQIALTALVGLLRSDLYTQVDTKAFCDKYKMADLFFVALLELGCLVRPDDEAKADQFKHTHLLLSIDPDLVVTRVRNLGKRGVTKTSNIAWHSAIEEQMPKPGPLMTKVVTETPMLNKALKQVEHVPDSLIAAPPAPVSVNVSIDKLQTAWDRDKGEITQLCLDYVAGPDKQVVSTEQPQPTEDIDQETASVTVPLPEQPLPLALSEAAKEFVKQFVSAILSSYEDEPQTQLLMVKAMEEELRTEQRVEADRLHLAAKDLFAQAEKLKQKALVYNPTLSW